MGELAYVSVLATAPLFIEPDTSLTPNVNFSGGWVMYRVPDLVDAAIVPRAKGCIQESRVSRGVAEADDACPGVEYFVVPGAFLSRKAENRMTWISGNLDYPFAQCFATSGRYVSKSSDTQEEADALNVYQLNWFDTWDISNVIHDEAVAVALRSSPG